MRNAIITGTRLGREHGCMTYMITLDYGDSGCQGAGGYALDEYDKTADKRIGTPYGIDSITQLMDAVGVRYWEDLPGTHVRVEATHSGVQAIGHIMKDQWYNFGDHASQALIRKAAL